MSRPLLALAALAVSALQAWDSHALDAPRFIQAAILAGVIVPAASIALSRDVRVRAGSVALSAVLMVLARLLSTVPLPGLALAAFFPGIIVALEHMAALNQESRKAAAADRSRE
jgi:hypothetical protein